MRQKVQWNDIRDATQQELKKTYKLSDRQLEQQMRTHLDGANAEQRRKAYEMLYGKRK